MEGYSLSFDQKLVTIFSTPNFCYRCDNLGAFMKVHSNGEREYVVFPQIDEEMKHLERSRSKETHYFL